MQEIITPSQVAALLQVHVKTVYRLAEQGVIPGSRIGRRWRFSRKDILSLVSNKHRNQRPENQSSQTAPHAETSEENASLYSSGSPRQNDRATQQKGRSGT